jgi:hypothetical protein
MSVLIETGDFAYVTKRVYQIGDTERRVFVLVLWEIVRTATFRLNFNVAQIEVSI